MTDIQIRDQPDAKFVLSAPPPMPCCVLYSGLTFFESGISPTPTKFLAELRVSNIFQ